MCILPLGACHGTHRISICTPESHGCHFGPEVAPVLGCGKVPHLAALVIGRLWCYNQVFDLDRQSGKASYSAESKA